MRRLRPSSTVVEGLEEGPGLRGVDVVLLKSLMLYKGAIPGSSFFQHPSEHRSLTVLFARPPKAFGALLSSSGFDCVASHAFPTPTFQRPYLFIFMQRKVPFVDRYPSQSTPGPLFSGMHTAPGPISPFEYADVNVR